MNLSEGIQGSHNAVISMFLLCKPHTSYLENTYPLPHSVCSQGSLLFICVCYYMAHTDVFVWFHWCAHIHWDGKKEVSIANLLKGKTDSHCFPLARLPFRGWDLTLHAPEQKASLLCKSRNGSLLMECHKWEKNVIHRAAAILEADVGDRSFHSQPAEAGFKKQFK